jgi:hypothetical protein
MNAAVSDRPAPAFPPTPLDIHRADAGAFVGVTALPHANMIYVLLDTRRQFDLIALPARDSGDRPQGRVLTKALEQGDVMITFQYWPGDSTTTDRDDPAAARPLDHQLPAGDA